MTNINYNENIQWNEFLSELSDHTLNAMYLYKALWTKKSFPFEYQNVIYDDKVKALQSLIWSIQHVFGAINVLVPNDDNFPKWIDDIVNILKNVFSANSDVEGCPIDSNWFFFVQLCVYLQKIGFFDQCHINISEVLITLLKYDVISFHDFVCSYDALVVGDCGEVLKIMSKIKEDVLIFYEKYKNYSHILNNKTLKHIVEGRINVDYINGVELNDN